MKKKNYKIVLYHLIILSFVLFCSCQETENIGFEVIDTQSVSDTLQAEVVSFENQTELLNPAKIVNINNDYLVISQEIDEGLFQVFDLPDLNFLYAWGKQGQGPDEFMVLPVTEINTKDEEIILYELAKMQLRFYTVTDTSFLKMKESTLSYDEQTDPLTHIQRLQDSLFVADYGTSFENTNQEHIVLKPGQSEEIFTFGEYPDSELEDVDRYFSYLKTSATKPDGSRFAAFYLYHNLLKIYNSNGEELYAVEISDPLLPDEADKDNFQYRKVASVSDRYIYTIGLHATGETLSDEENSFTTSLEVWDWEGRQVYRAKFDKLIHGFTVSEKYNKLYGYSFLVMDELFVYDLPGEY